MARTIFHVDMDAFFAAIEVREDPSLRGKPVLVGGAGRRGVVAAASYEARVFGCHSAQPMAVALRRCPQAVVLPARHDLYSEVSAEVFTIFDRFSPLVEALSIDEAFLDMTGSDRLLGSPRGAAEALRAAVQKQTELTCSVGIASVKFIAKIASAANKPNGITVVEAGTELEFLAPLPIGKLWGVGSKTEARLREHGVRTVGDLREIGASRLEAWFGEHGLHLHRLSHAEDARVVTPGVRRKQISHEDTYADDVKGLREIRRKLLSQATRVADRLVAKHAKGRRVQLKIRDIEFTTETRQCTLKKPTNKAREIYEAACELLTAVDVAGRRFRLTGVGVSELVRDDDQQQLELAAVVDPEEQTSQKLQDVLSAVRQRFGHEALFPADAGPQAREGVTGAVTRTLDRSGTEPDDSTE